MRYGTTTRIAKIKVLVWTNQTSWRILTNKCFWGHSLMWYSYLDIDCLQMHPYLSEKPDMQFNKLTRGLYPLRPPLLLESGETKKVPSEMAGVSFVQCQLWKTSNFYYSGNSSDVCSTTSCVLAAASFLESMDETIDPCQDFYSFVCGNFIDKVNS